MGSKHLWRKLSSLHLGNLVLQNKQSIKVHFFRVPLIIVNRAARFNFGFASNMVLLLWCVFGGLLLHMLEANFLSILLKPVYEKPIDTAEDVLARGLAIIVGEGREGIVELWKNSPSKISRDLAASTIVPNVIFS